MFQARIVFSALRRRARDWGHPAAQAATHARQASEVADMPASQRHADGRNGMRRAKRFIDVTLRTVARERDV
ncbi:hypothetical protein [Burkholderia anthina]|uniref:hypothetical protein n=1 Tax=Burkholderia anthina TaxID=179879 RepID=UPI001589BA70|nr:hypothetical protein [Burkholderia anthina]